MKKLYSLLLTILCIVVGAGIFSGCQKDENTAVKLDAFGPCPVLRGSEIRFIGDNLDRITAVVIPGCPDITTITRVSTSEIKVTVPQEAVSGYIVLKYAGGQITTRTVLSFTEPYSISAIAPLTAIREGANVTITGDYLWDIVAVIFSGNAEEATVDSANFISQSRTSIALKVPRGAASGKIQIADIHGNTLYSDQELNIIQPAITALSPLTIKAGAELTVTGTNLDLVTAITFQGGTVVNADVFVSQSATQIVVLVPEDCRDGVIISTAYSRDTYTSSDALIMVVPTGLAVAAPVSFKAGNMVEISGNDLDLVTTLSFNSGVNAAFSYAAGIITATIPTTATDGVITLNTAAGKNVTTPSITLVKPVITGFTPAIITAGDNLTINGTDLDLVNAVRVGNFVCSIVSQSITDITIATPLNCTSGLVEVTAANGDIAVSSSMVTVNPSTKPTVTSMPTSAKPGDEITLYGTNLNNVRNVLFQTVAVTQYALRSPGTLTFTVPLTAPFGLYSLIFELYEGADVQTDDPISISGVEPVVDWDYVFFDFDGKDSWWGVGTVGNDPGLSLNGNYIHIDYTGGGGWVTYFARNGGHFNYTGVDVSTWSYKFDVNVLSIDPGITFKVRLGNFWYIWACDYPAGTNGWITVTLPLNQFRDNDGFGVPFTNADFPGVNEWSFNHDGGAGSINMLIDNVRFWP